MRSSVLYQFNKEDVVVKRLILLGIVCDKPCWLLWIKVYNAAGILPLPIKLYNNRSTSGGVHLDITAGKKQFSYTPFRKPVRFSKGIYAIFSSIIIDVEFGFVPDY